MEMRLPFIYQESKSALRVGISSSRSHPVMHADILTIFRHSATTKRKDNHLQMANL